MLSSRPVSHDHAYRDRVLGCLIGGAVGDAFGYAIEFDQLDAIRRHHGPAGLRTPVLRNGRLQVSDDTQMTLFTLEGLTRAVGSDGTWNMDSAVTEVRRAYLDWLDTQQEQRTGQRSGRNVGGAGRPARAAGTGQAIPASARYTPAGRAPSKRRSTTAKAAVVRCAQLQSPSCPGSTPGLPFHWERSSAH